MKGANVMKTLTQPAESVSGGQIKLITRQISDVADSDLVQEALAALTKKGAERLKSHPDFVSTLRQRVVETVAEFSVVNEFANEEVESRYGYLSGYSKPLDLNAQCNQLRILFPGGLGFANQDLLMRIEKGEVKLPQHAEGWFAIPNWQKNPKIFGSTYSEALLVILDTIKKARDGKFWNYRDGQVEKKHLRQSAVSREAWAKLAKEQGDADILIIPAQFALRHRGRSVRRARVIIEDTPGEVGLGAFATGAMLLTHPNRLKHLDDLWIDLTGDEWSPGGDGDFSESPFFGFRGDEVKFGTGYVDCPCVCCGSASWFSS